MRLDSWSLSSYNQKLLNTFNHLLIIETYMNTLKLITVTAITGAQASGHFGLDSNQNGAILSALNMPDSIRQQLKVSTPIDQFIVLE